MYRVQLLPWQPKLSPLPRKYKCHDSNDLWSSFFFLEITTPSTTLSISTLIIKAGMGSLIEFLAKFLQRK